MPACSACLLRRAKMQRVSEVLQFPIIIEGRRPLALELQLREEHDFLLRRITAEGRILQEGCKAWLLVARIVGDPFKKLKFLQVLGD